MKLVRTFATEDRRKTKLFDAWISYFEDFHQQEKQFEEILETDGLLVKCREGRIDIKLNDAKKSLVSLEIPEEIVRHSSVNDMMYVVLGRNGKAWFPLDVITVGSLVNKKKGEFHMTVNPRHHNPLMMRMPQSNMH